MPRDAENSDFYRFVARDPLLASLFKTKSQNVVRTELNSRIGPYALPLAGGGAKRRRAVVRRHPTRFTTAQPARAICNKPALHDVSAGLYGFPFSFRVTVPRPATRKILTAI